MTDGGSDVLPTGRWRVALLHSEVAFAPTSPNTTPPRGKIRNTISVGSVPNEV